jgi:hypothetical protein
MEKFGFINNLTAGLQSFLIAVSLLFLMASCAQNTPVPVQKKFYSIRGTVTNLQGTPIEDVAVAIVEGTASYPEIAAMTNEKGEFGLGGLENGTYTVQAMYAGRTGRAEAVIRDADAQVTIAMGDQ